MDKLLRGAMFVSLLAGLAGCGVDESAVEDPCGQYSQCATDVLIGCSNSSFGDECVAQSIGPACFDLLAMCERESASDI